MTKKARADARKDYAKHIAEGRPVCYPWTASMKPWPESRWTEAESEEDARDRYMDGDHIETYEHCTNETEVYEVEMR